MRATWTSAAFSWMERALSGILWRRTGWPFRRCPTRLSPAPARAAIGQPHHRRALSCRAQQRRHPDALAAADANGIGCYGWVPKCPAMTWYSLALFSACRTDSAMNSRVSFLRFGSHLPGGVIYQGPISTKQGSLRPVPQNPARFPRSVPLLRQWQPAWRRRPTRFSRIRQYDVRFAKADQPARGCAE
jgi:hypothetical protein